MDEWSERIARRFDAPMLVAALLVVPIVAVEQSNVGEPWCALAAVLNWAIWLAFAAEVVVMLVTSVQDYGCASGSSTGVSVTGRTRKCKIPYSRATAPIDQPRELLTIWQSGH